VDGSTGVVFRSAATEGVSLYFDLISSTITGISLMAGLKIGQTAPRFSLKDKDGKAYSLGASKTDYTVLYFYPKDDTPGCTLEAKEFSKFIEKFHARNVSVVGVSGGNEKTKAKFCAKHALKVPLVSDTDFKVAKSYGAYGTKQFMGRTFQGIFRKTFLVDNAGKIARIFDTVKPEGHAEEVLAAIDDLSKKVTTKKDSKPNSIAKKTLSKKTGTKGAGVTRSAKKPVKVKSTTKRAAKRVARTASTKRVVKKAAKKK
jgi:peroxiredoxin Q/BCP